jgi:hypothetical protein
MTMRTGLLMLMVAFGLFRSATAVAADAPAAPGASSEAAQSSQPAVWTRRKLLDFSGPSVITSETGTWEAASCDRLYDDVKFVLLELGARASDMAVDQRGCYAATSRRSLDVTFSVLAPIDRSGNAVAGEWVAAHWNTVALKGNCAFLEYVTVKVLPLFSTQDAKRIPISDCTRLGGVGLYAKILMPAATR